MRTRLFWPIILIALGVLLLLDNLNLLPGSVWGYVWPILLIGAGLNLLQRRGRSAATVEDSTALDGATSAELTFRHGAGKLAVRGGARRDLLHTGHFAGGVDKQVERRVDRLVVTLAARARDWIGWMGPWDGSGSLDWDVQLNTEVPLILVFETGASSNMLDLSLVKAREITVSTGASSTRLVLPAQAGETRARVRSGAASVEIVVPEGVAARIRGTVGVGALQVAESRFPRRDGAYESPDFAAASNRAEIDVESGVGSVRVR